MKEGKFKDSGARVSTCNELCDTEVPGLLKQSLVMYITLYFKFSIISNFYILST